MWVEGLLCLALTCGLWEAGVMQQDAPTSYEAQSQSPARAENTVVVQLGGGGEIGRPDVTRFTPF